MGDFETVKDAVSIRDFAEQHMRKSGGNMWCCPICKSGEHGTASSDGALSITRDGKHWECFSCHAQGDVFDIAGAVFGIDDRRGQLEAVAGWAGITLEGTGRRSEAPRRERPRTAPDYSEGRRREVDYIRRARAGIESPEAVAYLAGRGFTLDDARAAGFGYDAEKRRLVIPWRGCEWYHTDRAIDEGAKPKYLKPSADKVGPQPLYNADAAKEPVFFLVEGVLDAVAVELCGFEAVAVASNNMSARNAGELTEAIKARGGGSVAVLMLDDDDAGREGAELIGGALDAAGVGYVTCSGERPKDAAEWFEADREALRAFLGRWRDEAANKALEAREEAYRAALGHLRVIDPASVASDIFTLSDAEEPIGTGFRLLDDVLDGGLRSGLYALGAVSSMGKTTFSVQVADRIAAQGRPVLFCSIEQSAREIVAKSLSRITYEANTGGWNVVSPTEAVSPARRARWSDGQTEAFLSACEQYAATIAPNLRILEGTKQPGVADVEAVARVMQAHDGTAPVIFIDYLQLLRAPGSHDTDKQATDKNVMLLRQLARDLKTPVWVISSLNRSSYSEGVTMDAWKESGAVEYGCDVLLGLQPFGLRERIDGAKDSRVRREADKAIRQNKAGHERACEIVVLKNRNGATPEDGLPVTFKPLSALYVEGGSHERL